MTQPPERGAVAPGFSLPGSHGETITLDDYSGQNVVVYFYPKDMTPGCTTEALDFSAQKPAFDAANTAIIGISADPPARHAKFTAKHDLTIQLASDEDHETCDAFGVWVEKSMYGRKFFGIERSTFLIGPDRRIVEIWRKVRVKTHVDEVLAAVRAL
jgi:peroxiredoxin Q/BCP